MRLRPKWQKAWYRFGRALYDQGKVAEAEAAFAEGIQLDLGNGEMLRWRAKCRKRLDELRVDAMKKKRYATDYSKFAAVEAEADIPDEDANTSYRQTDAPVVDTVEEMHDLMNKKQQAQLDAQAPTDIYFRSDMIFLPQAESPAELQEEGAFAAMAARSAAGASARRTTASAWRRADSSPIATSRLPSSRTRVAKRSPSPRGAVPGGSWSNGRISGALVTTSPVGVRTTAGMPRRSSSRSSSTRVAVVSATPSTRSTRAASTSSSVSSRRSRSDRYTNRSRATTSNSTTPAVTTRTRVRRDGVSITDGARSPHHARCG